MHCLWEIIDNSVDEALAGFGDTDRDHPAQGRLGRGPGPRPRHPGGRGAQDRPVRRRGRHDQAARRRQVRRRLLRRLRRSARRRRLGGERAQLPRRHRGGPGRDGPRASRSSAASPGCSPATGRTAKFKRRVRTAQGRQGLAGARPKSAEGRRAAPTGTRTRFWPDRQIFLKDAEFVLEDLHARARQTAFLVPGPDDRGASTSATAGRTEEIFSYAGGISEFVEFLAPDRPITDTLRFTGSGKFTETVPVLDDAGHMTPADIERELFVDVALRWGTEYDTVVRSFVNIIATPKGGTHLVGFGKRSAEGGQRAAAGGQAAEGQRRRRDPRRRLRGPDRGGHRPAGRAAVRGPDQGGPGHPGGERGSWPRVVDNAFKEFLTSAKRNDKPMARGVLEKIANAARTRITARQHKEAQRRKNALETSALPAKLADCRSDDVDRSEMFIIEGDSAMGSAKAGAQLGVPGAAADPRQDPERPEVLDRRHAEERRVRGHHPGRRRRLRPLVRHRPGALRQGDPDGRRRRRRLAHPLPAADPVPPVHAADAGGRARLRRRAAAAPDRGDRRGPGEERVSSTRTRTTRCAARSPSC